jgi:hypothetical protein
MTTFKATPIALSIMLAVAGCAPVARIESSKSASYTVEPKRVFVYTEMYDLGNAFTVGFEKRFAAILQECGASAQFGRIGKADLEEKYVDEMRKFGPDAVLSTRRNGGTRDQYGNLVVAIFDSRLADVKTGNVTWRANSTVRSGGLVFDAGARGDAFAVELSNKLKQDQVFRSCPVFEPKK